MRLSITTPLAVIFDTEGVTHLRAEDETGAFGILQGHADFLTVLAVSVMSWRDAEGEEHHVAVNGGMLEVGNGNRITVATPEAIPGDDLDRLETEVLAAFRRKLDEERVARTDAERLYLAAIRQICRYLRPEKAPGFAGGARGVSVDGLDQ
jgi:F-type H+-transporting ATPase subunit epsilon